MNNFLKELEQLINKCSIENDSDTPDFILAQYLVDCLETYATVTKSRDKWYGYKPFDTKATDEVSTQDTERTLN